MRRNAVGLIGLVAVGVFGATSLAQSTPRAKSIAKSSAARINFTATTRELTFSSPPGFPRPRKLPSVLLQAGFATSKVGNSTVQGWGVDRSTYTGHPSRNTYTYKTDSVTYNDAGTLRGAITARYTIRPNGKIDTVAHGHFTGGTGGYRGITGTFAVTGHNPHGKFWVYSTHGTLVFP